MDVENNAPLTPGAPRTNYWIFSLPFDLFFFSALWWFLALPILFFQVNDWRYLGFFLLAYQAGLRVPHFLATLPLTFLLPENKQHYRQNWIKFLAIPLGILLVYLCFGSDMKSGLVPKLLVTISAVWGLQHISFQNHGIFQLYQNRAGLQNGPRRKISQLIFLVMFLSLTVAHGISKFWFPESLTKGVQNGILYSQYFLVLGGVLFTFLSSRHLGWRAVPSLLFLLTALLGMIYWPIYDSVPNPGGGVLLFYLMYNGHHQLSYLGLTYYLLANKSIKSSGRNTVHFTIRHFLVFFLPLLLASTVAVVIGYRSGTSLTATSELQKFLYHSFPILEGYFVLHFYLDSISWKARDQHARNTLFAYLEPISQPAMPDAMSPS